MADLVQPNAHVPTASHSLMSCFARGRYVTVQLDERCRDGGEVSGAVCLHTYYVVRVPRFNGATFVFCLPTHDSNLPTYQYTYLHT